jgi:cyclophilin family peptidyl-prolyl cis-trans isomerase
MSSLRRIGVAAVLIVTMHSGAIAQTMRFATNVGNFDMELNPTNDPNLRPLVDNIVAYIGLGRYSYTAINRAVDGDPGTADDFVLQMGSFLAFPPVPDLWPNLLQSVDALDPIVVDVDNDGAVDFTAQSNTRGTVSLALQANNPNSGTSSFFINLGSNTGLDPQGFVPFARINDMSTIDRIMQLMQTDLSDDIGQSGNLAFTDVPLTENGRLVVLKSVRVLQADPGFNFIGPVQSALRQIEQSAALAALAPPASSPSLAATPEPSSLALGLMALIGATRLRLRCRWQASHIG